MRTMILSAVMVASLVSVGSAAEETWTAVISDSHCGAIHKTDIEHGGNITARECVVGRPGDASLPGCVSAKYGATFVLVIGEKVYQVANQDFADLRAHAAEKVAVTGSLKGETITVTKIAVKK